MRSGKNWIKKDPAQKQNEQAENTDVNVTDAVEADAACANGDSDEDIAGDHAEHIVEEIIGAAGDAEPEAADDAEGEPAADAALEKALKERDDYLDMAQRIKAEFENYKRRNQSVRAEAWEDGARETIAQMLPVIDNLERALDAATEKTPLRDGLELILKQMSDLLEKRGVAEISRLGEPFDPELENAVMQADASEGEPGTVCAVLQKGYKTASRVIRYAMVRVVASE